MLSFLEPLELRTLLSGDLVVETDSSPGISPTASASPSNFHDSLSTEIEFLQYFVKGTNVGFGVISGNVLFVALTNDKVSKGYAFCYFIATELFHLTLLDLVQQNAEFLQEKHPHLSDDDFYFLSVPHQLMYYFSGAAVTSLLWPGLEWYFKPCLER